MSLGIRVSKVGERISVDICVSKVTGGKKFKLAGDSGGCRRILTNRRKSSTSSIKKSGAVLISRRSCSRIVTGLPCIGLNFKDSLAGRFDSVLGPTTYLTEVFRLCLLQSVVSQESSRMGKGLMTAPIIIRLAKRWARSTLSIPLLRLNSPEDALSFAHPTENLCLPLQLRQIIWVNPERSHILS